MKYKRDAVYPKGTVIVNPENECPGSRALLRRATTCRIVRGELLFPGGDQEAAERAITFADVGLHLNRRLNLLFAAKS
jgi:hypothetical protein